MAYLMTRNQPMISTVAKNATTARFQQIINNALDDSKTDVEVQDSENQVVVFTYADDFFTTTVFNTETLEVIEFFADDGDINYNPYTNILNEVNLDFTKITNDLNMYLMEKVA